MRKLIIGVGCIFGMYVIANFATSPDTDFGTYALSSLVMYFLFIVGILAFISFYNKDKHKDKDKNDGGFI